MKEKKDSKFEKETKTAFKNKQTAYNLIVPTMIPCNLRILCQPFTKPSYMTKKKSGLIVPSHLRQSTDNRDTKNPDIDKLMFVVAISADVHDFLKITNPLFDLDSTGKEPKLLTLEVGDRVIMNDYFQAIPYLDDTNMNEYRIIHAQEIMGVVKRKQVEKNID